MTAALAGTGIAGAGLLAVMWAIVGRGPLSIDRDAFSLLAIARTHTNRVVFHRVAELGTIALLVVLVLLILSLLVRRRWRGATTLGLGFPLAWGASEVAKMVAQRPRPLGQVLFAGGYGFPSTDAALAVGFVAMSLVVAADLTDRRARSAVTVGGALLGLGISALVIALRDHYVTDVLGGWGLGATVFCGVALLAVVIDRTADPADR